MAGTSRLVVLALLVGMATVGVARRPVPEPAEQRQSAERGEPTVGLWVLIGLATLCLAIAVIAVLRFRRRNPAAWPRPPRVRLVGNRWLGLLVLLGILGLPVGAALLARRFDGGTQGTPRQVPPPSTDRVPPTPAADPSTAADAPDWLLLAFLALLLLIGATALAGRRPPEDPVPAGTGEDSPRTALVQAFERGLSAVAEPARDARTAIIRCYAALEAALSAVPAAAPQVADSPSEVVQRAATAGAVRAPGAWRLVELFDEARFSRHAMSTEDRADAEEALRHILDELRAAPCSPG